MARKISNWLEGLSEYIEDTEAPRAYWLWGGIFTICAALQRRVWIPHGLENVYPNLYLLIVAKPGERKGGPPTLSKKLLEAVQVPVAVDSSSKRALTEELAEVSKTEQFLWKAKPIPMATLAVISKEMSSLLAVDPKGIIEVLTDLYDSHDVWKYKTSGKGEDFLYNVCVSCFIVTTPTWLVNNLPDEAIGGGYTSRHVIVAGGQRHKLVPFPPKPNKKLLKMLVEDLRKITTLVGEFELHPEARKLYKDWYSLIPQKQRLVKDDRIHGYLNRMHVIALKVSMALRVAYSNDLIVSPDDMGQSLDLINESIESSSLALGGHGRSKLGPDTDMVINQVKGFGTIPFKELMSLNYRNLSKTDLESVLETIESMGKISKPFVTEKNDIIIKWKGGK